MRNTRYRVFLNVSFALVLFMFLYSSSFVSKKSLGTGFLRQPRKFHGRVLQENDEISSNVTNSSYESVEIGQKKLSDPQICAEIISQKGYHKQCDYLITHPDCGSDGFFNYIKFFYCDCKNFSFFGYLVLGAWLAVLFYLLGNTASDYFCPSLENLADVLKMSPAVAGVTLLPLGNGAPDVFASIAAFVGTDSGDVGLNGVLGGAVFLTCIVVGVISICIADKRIQIDRDCFIGDICFFIFTLLCLTVILIIGKVNIWGALAFVSVYVIYAFSIAVKEFFHKQKPNDGQESDSMTSPLLSPPSLSPVNSEPQPNCVPMPVPVLKLPHWVWNLRVAIFSDNNVKTDIGNGSIPLSNGTNEVATREQGSLLSRIWSLLELPLKIPRQLTIPIVEEDRWSKPYAVGSATFAPLLLAFLWNTQDNTGAMSGKIAYFVGIGVGIILGLLAFFCTSKEHPPARKYLFPWLLGGFFMSIVWFYIIANELVSLLVTFGVILGIHPSLLALTVLAWGNSVGDLMANTALALKESRGVQIAMSGSFAGPMFNTIVGLGLSLLLGAWSMGSKPYVIPRDNNLFITMGFLTAGLLWSLVVLPYFDMRPNRILGVGLITIYVIFLSLRIATAIGLGSVVGTGIQSLQGLITT